MVPASTFSFDGGEPAGPSVLFPSLSLVDAYSLPSSSGLPRPCLALAHLTYPLRRTAKPQRMAVRHSPAQLHSRPPLSRPDSMPRAWCASCAGHASRQVSVARQVFPFECSIVLGGELGSKLAPLPPAHPGNGSPQRRRRGADREIIVRQLSLEPPLAGRLPEAK